MSPGTTLTSQHPSSATFITNGHTLPPGNGGEGIEDSRLQQFYAQLSRLEDEIIAGKHPHYELPDVALRQLLTRSTHEATGNARRQSSPSLLSSSSPTKVRADALKEKPFADAALPSGQKEKDSYARKRNGGDFSASQKPFPDARRASAAVQGGPVGAANAASRTRSDTVNDVKNVRVDVARKSDRAAPEIPPVLPTLPIDPAKAEMLLKRQKIERALRDELEEKRTAAAAARPPKGTRDSYHAFSNELFSEIDVTAHFNEAMKLVKPVSGLRVIANANSSGSVSASVDDSSNLSPHEDGASSMSEGQIVDKDVGQGKEKDTGKDKNVIREGNDQLEGQKKAAQTNARSTMPIRDKGQEPLSGEKGHPRKKSYDVSKDYAAARRQDLHAQNVQRPAQPREAREESDYSPPVPENYDNFQGVTTATHTKQHIRDISKGTIRSIGKQDVGQGNVDEPPRGHPSPVVPIIRNHIEHPLAPQPARVSPLAVAKMPRLDQSKPHQQRYVVHDTEPSTSQVPPATSQAAPETAGRPVQNEWSSSRYPAQSNQMTAYPDLRLSRKRTREPEVSEVQLQGSAPKRLARSPLRSVEPIIKQEPISPIPIDDMRALRRRYVRAYADEVEYLPRRDSIPIYYVDEPYARPMYRYEYDEPISPEYVQARPRLYHRRVEREEPDPRRSFSLQHTRRRSSLIYAQPPAHAQAPLSARLPTPHYTDRPTYYEEPYVPQGYVRRRVSRSPPRYVGAQGPDDPISIDMPPPVSRRVIYDSYGQRYEAVPNHPPQPWRESARLPARRIIEGDPYHERAAAATPLPSYQPMRYTPRERRPSNALTAAAPAPIEISDDDSHVERVTRPIAGQYQEPISHDRGYLERTDPYARAQPMRMAEGRGNWQRYEPFEEIAERRPRQEVRYGEVMLPIDYAARPYSARAERRERDVREIDSLQKPPPDSASLPGTVQAPAPAPASASALALASAAAEAPPPPPPPHRYRQSSVSVPRPVSRQTASTFVASSVNANYKGVPGNSASMRDGIVDDQTREGRFATGRGSVAAERQYVPIQEQQERQELLQGRQDYEHERLAYADEVSRQHVLPLQPPPPPSQAHHYLQQQPQQHQRVRSQQFQAESQRAGERYMAESEAYDPTAPGLMPPPLQSRREYAMPEARTVSYRY